MFLAVFAYLAARFNYPRCWTVQPKTCCRPSWRPERLVGRVDLLQCSPDGFPPSRSRCFRSPRRAPWPTHQVHLDLTRARDAAAAGDRLVIDAVFDGLNRYLGNFIGEFLGELSFSTFFILSGLGLLRHARAPRWLGWLGFATGALGLIGVSRNVTPAIETVAAANNYLLPAWMIGFGAWLILASRRTGAGE